MAFNAKSLNLISCLLAFFLPFSASSSAAASDPQAPAEYQQCLACHGANGEGNPALKAPALAGQLAPYLQRQLAHFRAGTRASGNEAATMIASLQAVDASADKAISEWLAKLKPTMSSEAPDPEAELRKGENGYIGRCGACHGAKAEGNHRLDSPSLLGQSSDYLLRQLQQFIDGERGHDGDDRPGRQMAMMAKTVPEPNDQRDIVAYIISLNTAKAP